MDRVRFIELIEGETARLSLEGRVLWEELEFIRESIPDPADESRMAREYEVMERIFELPMTEQFLVSRLAELVAALRRSEEAPRRAGGGGPSSRRDQRRHAQGPGRGSDSKPEHDTPTGDRPANRVRCAGSFA